jgi:hypothetical protein
MQQVCGDRYQQFSAAGQASKIKQWLWMTLLLSTLRAS